MSDSFDKAWNIVKEDEAEDISWILEEGEKCEECQAPVSFGVEPGHPHEAISHDPLAEALARTGRNPNLSYEMGGYSATLCRECAARPVEGQVDDETLIMEHPGMFPHTPQAYERVNRPLRGDDDE